MSGSAPGWGRKGEQVTLDLCEHLHIHCLTSSTEGACAQVLLTLTDWESRRDVKAFGPELSMVG